MEMETKPVNPTQRLYCISGYEDRNNDIIYCPPKYNSPVPDTIVYFGGDVQDYSENMEKQRDGKNYVDWNLENTAIILQSKFPKSHIAVIKPTRMEYLTFSCYKNVVPCNDFGIPEHTSNHHALDHLQALLQNAALQIAHSLKDDTSSGTSSAMGTEPPDLSNNDVILIGFSKGCVVLNQMLHEFHRIKKESIEDEVEAIKLMGRIKEMYWLDGGHSGGRNTWITTKPILDTLAKLGILLHVHVTPYQIDDERRPWIKKEERQFSDTLKRFGASIKRVLHFENDIPTILVHFNVLNVFKQDVDN